MKILQESQNKSELKTIPSNSEINRMIARDDKEFELFEKMDIEKEKAKKENWIARGNQGDPPPPLMAKEELPEWLQEVEISEEDAVEYGRGMRARSEVSYTDSMSDAKFNKVSINFY